MSDGYEIVCAVCGAPDVNDEFYYNYKADNYVCSDECTDVWIECNYAKVAQYYKEHNFD